MIELRKLNWENWEECAALKVKEEQSDFIASNLKSLAESYIGELHDEYPPINRVIYNDNAIIGFTLLYYATTEEYGYKGEDGYWIGRFMIDEKYQGKGYGKQALIKVIDFLKTFPIKKSKYVYLSYGAENKIAQKLYSSYGFIQTGEILNGEIVAVHELS